MTKRTLTFEDLRPDPEELCGLAEQFKDAPASPPSGWGGSRLKLGDGIYLQPDWNDGPTVRLEIEF